MKTAPPAPADLTGAPAASAAPPAAAGAASPAREMHVLGAHVLTLLLLMLGTIISAVSLIEWRWGSEPGFALDRLGLGLAFAAVAAVAVLLRRRAPRFTLALLLVSVVLGLAVNAWRMELGVHMLALAAACLAVALAGPTLGMRAAFGLMLLQLLALGVLAWAEAAGHIQGRHAEATMGMQTRLIGHLLLAVGGLSAAALLARMVGAALARAAHEHGRVAELLELGSDWTWELDARARLVALSPSFEKRAGYLVADFLRLGQPGGPSIVQDEDWGALQQELRERREFRETPVNYTGPDGAVMHTLVSGAPVFDAGGLLTGWRGVGRNVTAEHQARLQQQRSETLLNRLFEASPDAVCVGRGSDGQVLLANAGFLKLTGLAQHEVVGHSIVDIGLWPDLDEPRRVLRQMRAAGGAVRDLRTTVHLRDGSQREVLVSAAGFEADGGVVAVVTLRDITEVERARRESDAILDNASVGIALVRRGRIERANAALEAMLGYPPGALAGQQAGPALQGGVAPGGGESERRLRLPSIVQPGPAHHLEMEREVRRADGQRILIRLRARPADPAQPQRAGTIWVVEDITARRAGEEALAQAKLQADAANQAKSAFLATMSHEIRTPLNGVLGLAQLLQEPALDASRRAGYLAHLADSARLLSGIVSDVLDLSKIESGQMQLEQIVFDLPEVVEGTFSAFAALGQERGLAMRCQLEAGVPRHVRGDPVRLRQILANYLSNALKFTERGAVTLQVQLRHQGMDPSQPDGLVRLSVLDSGPGVAPSLQGRLFEPFLQADSSTTRRYGGTGLGLSICRQLAHLMGGEVGVDSDGTSGSLFWAELPLPAAAPPHAGGVGVGGAEALPPLHGLTVLVAEDNTVNMLIVVAMLQRLGAQVLEASDGEMALALAREHAQAIGVVLMDLHMPGCDGLAATRALRAEPATAALPIFAFSAAVLDQERRAAEAEGMNGFIAKPVQVADLLRALAPFAPFAPSAPSAPFAPSAPRTAPSPQDHHAPA